MICTDKEKIKKIIFHPDVVDFLSDDGSSNIRDVSLENTKYLINEDETGIIRVDMLNSLTVSIHMALMPEAWGSGYDFSIRAIRWGAKNLVWVKIVAMIPKYNEKTIGLVKKLNFKCEGIITKSFMKNWQLHDILIYTVNKEDLSCLS